MSLTVAVSMPAEDRAELVRWTRSPSLRAGLAQRARIALLADQGVGTNEIVERVGVSKPTVIAWKKRYAAAGIGGLEDLPKPGRPVQVDEVAVVLATLEPPPERLGVTHWSSRLLADHLSGQGTVISNVWVAKIWRKWGLQPWRRETFKFSTDPSWRPRSATSSACTWPRRRRQSCSRSTKSPRSRRWTGPRRSCRCGRACRRRPPTTTSGTALPPCSPPWRSRPGR